jgi:ribosomal protein S18 acetylase RimI-like enzyme
MPLPATLLGRLATHTSQQGRGLGTQLLLHAMRTVLHATRFVASIGVVVDAMNEGLVAFYERNGFVPLLDKPRHLIAPISRIRALFPAEAAVLPDVAEIFQRIQAKEALDELGGL